MYTMATEQKPTNRMLEIAMIQLSNNSRLTQQAALMLSNALTPEQITELLQWFRHAQTIQTTEIQVAGRRNRW